MFTQVLRNLSRGIRKGKSRFRGRCNICGHRTIFFGYDAVTLTELRFRNDLQCLFCRSVARQRAIAQKICAILEPEAASLKALAGALTRRDVRLHNAAARGVLHATLCRVPHYTCSEYFPGVPSGATREGIRCEDLQDLSFPDDSLDLFITEDVLEHVRKPARALEDIRRVLRPGGHHIFTVPLYGESTVVRVDTSGEADIHILPAVYHGDPLNRKGALAYHDFGEDIAATVDACGFRSQLFRFNVEDDNYKCGHVIVSQAIK